MFIVEIKLYKNKLAEILKMYKWFMYGESVVFLLLCRDIWVISLFAADKLLRLIVISCCRIWRLCWAADHFHVNRDSLSLKETTCILWGLFCLISHHYFLFISSSRTTIQVQVKYDLTSSSIDGYILQRLCLYFFDNL